MKKTAYLILFISCTITSIAQTVKSRVAGAANWSSAATWIQTRTGTISFSIASPTVTGTGTLFLSELQVGDILMMEATPGTVRGTIASIQSNTSLTLTTNSTQTVATAAYGRQKVPEIDDDVQIGNPAFAAVTISLDVASSTIKSLSFLGNGTGDVLIHSGANELNITNDVIINQPTSAVTKSWNINTGTANVNGNLTYNVSLNSSGRIARVAVTSGTLSVAGNIIMNNTLLAANSVLDLSGGAATLNLGGNFTFSSFGTFTPGVLSTVKFNGTGSQTMPLFTYANLQIDKPSGTASLTGNTIVTGNFTLMNGSFSTNGMNLYLGGSWFNYGGTYIPNSANDLVLFYGYGEIGGNTNTTFSWLMMYGSGSLTLKTNTTCSKLEFTSGSGSSHISHDPNVSLTVLNDVIIRQPTGGSSTNGWNINAGSAVVNGTVYLGTGEENNNNRIAKISITSGELTIDGDLILQATASRPVNATLDMTGGAGKVNVKGAVGIATGSWSGTILPGTTGTFNFNGTSAQAINFPSQIKFNNIQINNPAGVTAGVAFTSALVSGNIEVQSGIFNNGGFNITGASGKTFEVYNDATFNISGTLGMVTGFSTKIFNPTSTVNYSGTSQTVSAETYGHLTLSGSNTKTMPATALTVQGNFTTSGTIAATAGGEMTIGGNVTLGSGTTFGASSFTHHVAGNWTDNGATFTPGASTINFNGTAAQTLGGSAASLSLNNLTVSNSFDAVFVNLNTNISGTLDMNGANTVLIPSATTVFNNAAATGTITGTGTIHVTRIASVADYLNQYKFSTNTISSMTVDFSGAGSQSVNGFTYSGLRISGTGTKSASGNIVVNNNIDLLAATLALNAFSLDIKSTVTRTSGSIDASSGTLIFSSNSLQTIPASLFSTAINNLTINNTAGVTMNANHTVTGALTLSAGTLNLGTSVSTISGTISRTAGTINATSASLIFNGSSSQNIPSGSFTGAINYLTINNANNVVINNNVTITTALSLTAGSLDLNGSTVSLGGTVSGVGTFKGSSTSGIIINSAGNAGSINFNQSADESSNALANLIINSGSATLGSTLKIYTQLNVAGGSMNLNNQSLHIKSNVTNTARVARVVGTLNGATNVTVERFMPNNARRYRLISPGVNTTGSIRDNWMEGAMNTGFCVGCNVNPKPGYGTHITGSGGNTNGFDVTTTNNASLFTFNQTSGAWVAVTNTNATLDAKKGYLMFVRGDRSVDMTAPGAPITLSGTATTLRATGNLVIGDQTYSSLASNGAQSLITNPFASPISWSTIYGHGSNSTNFENYYTYWESKSGTRGVFVTVTSAGVKSNFSANATVEIQSGQSFFVKTRSGVTSPSLSIREQDKSTASNINVFRVGPQTEQLYTSLFFYNGSERINADGVLSAFNNSYSKNVDDNDALQIANWDEDVAIVRDGKMLSIEMRPLIDKDDTISIAVSRLKAQQYEWQFNPFNFNAPGLQSNLKDNYTNTVHSISLSTTTVIPFTVNSDPASFATNRFQILYSASTALPVNFMTVKAIEKNNKVEIHWTTANEVNVANYEVEKSMDGRHFKTIKTVAAKGNSSNEYFAVDEDPSLGIIYYRIKSNDASGEFKISKVVSVSKGIIENILTISPNPVTGNQIQLSGTELKSGRYNLKIYTATGQLIHSQHIDHDGGLIFPPIKIDHLTKVGLYQLSITGNGINKSLSFIKN